MKQYGPFALRIGIGGLFVFAGLMKLMNPQAVVGMLEGMGFPGPAFWAWVLILVELICGAAVLTGWRLKWSTIPLAVVLLVAIVANAVQPMMAMKDAALLAGVVSLYLSGAGAWALGK